MTSIKMDKLADEFARALLMPETEFRAVLARNTKDGLVDVDAVARHFHVTRTDAHLRGISLGLVKAW